MRKQMVALLAGAMLMMATSAMAVPLGNGPSAITATPSYGQPSLQTIADTVLGLGTLNINNDQTGVGVWTQSENDVMSFRVTYALTSGGPATPGILGIYNYADPNIRYDLMNVATTGSASFKIKANGTLQVNNLDTTSTGWSNSFGYYMTLSGKTLYTEDDKNTGEENMVASYLLPTGTKWNTVPLVGSINGDNGSFNGNDDWMLAFEYNRISEGAIARDFNDGVFLVEDMSAVPEPGTMMLLGMGMFGLAIYGKRRMNKEA